MRERKGKRCLGFVEMGKYAAVSQERGRGNGRGGHSVIPDSEIPTVPAIKNFKWDESARYVFSSKHIEPWRGPME